MMNETPMLAGRLAIFRINYKSDFILTLESDAGWMTPFCIKFWTGAPSQAYFAGWNGTTYTNCAPVDGDPTKLKVQFDDHHLPIGELKYQIGYHFTVADFPTTVEDEVLNQERVVISHDGQDEKVLLDFNGETAPDIQFALPAYVNEAQRIANEQQRIANEQTRIANEQQRIQNEEQRIAQETARVEEFASLKRETESAAQNANDAATLANAKAQLAADKAALAQAAATLANDKAALAQQKAEYAQQQGDYAKAQGDTAAADHQTAVADHQTAVADHQTAAADHTQAGNDHTRAESDHTRAESDHAAVELFVDSLGAFDISAYHATGGVLAKYANLAAALGTNGANIPDSLRKGGMSVKFVCSSDNKYRQYHLKSQSFNTTITNWQRDVTDEEIGVDKSITCAINAGGEYVNTDFRLAEGEDVGFYVDADAIAASGMVIKLYIYKAEGGDRISQTVTNKQQYASLRAIFGNFSGTIYGFAYYITNKSGAGNITTTFHYYGINDYIQELDDKIDTEVEVTNTEVSRVDKYSASAQKNAGGTQTFSFDVPAYGCEPSGRFKVSIAKDSKFRISVSSSIFSSDATNIFGYLYYSDRTTSSSISVHLSDGSDVVTASKDVVAIDFYVQVSKITSAGTINVTVNIASLLKEDYDSKFAALQKNAIKLVAIAPSTINIINPTVGDLYFNTYDNTVYEITVINPIDTRQRLDLTNSTAVFEYNKELYIYDGISLTRYHDNYSKDKKVVLDYSEYLVGPNINNDNTDSDRETYIYKELILDDIAADEFLRISCDSIVGAPASAPIKVYGITEQEVSTFVKSLGVGVKDVYPSTNCVKYRILLYPSTSGMSVSYATFTNVKVEKVKSEMPAYYIKDDYLKNKIDVIRSLMKAADGNFDAFAFVTDVHWPNNMKHTPSILAYMQKKVVIPRLMMGGDYADGINLDANNSFDAFNGKVYKTVGNHEYMNYLAELRDNSDMHAQDITDADIWAYLNSGLYDVVIGNANRNYYYVDNTVQKMRYIFLSVFEDIGTIAAQGFEQEQEDWLDDVALDMPDGYLAVIFSHYYMDISYPTSWTPFLTEIGSRIAEVADAHVGHIACMIAGHTHIDMMMKTDGGIPIFVTTCDKANPDIDETSARAEYVYSKRTNGTINEQAFDIVIINKTAKKVSLVRIGCPADNGGDTPLEIREQTYGA